LVPVSRLLQLISNLCFFPICKASILAQYIISNAGRLDAGYSSLEGARRWTVFSTICPQQADNTTQATVPVGNLRQPLY
jgi:hypothetical protein